MELTERTVRNNIMVQRSTKNGRRRILEAAETLFTEQGFNAVSIRDIAERCEVTNAALYYHFPSKAALFEEVLEQHAQRLDERMRAAVHEKGTYRDRVKVMLLEYAKITRIVVRHFICFVVILMGWIRSRKLIVFAVSFIQ